MENYSNNSNNKFLKFIAEKSFGLTLIFVGVVAVGILSFTGAGKYLLGSLLNGVNINTATNSNRYAYAENLGWIDFNPTGGSMQVGDNGLTGYAYGENIGWVSLGSSAGPTYLNTSITNYGVNSSTTGCTAGYTCLSGYAYGENVGWIDFNPTGGGVKINTSTGEFSGYAWGENIGWVSFSGTGYGVITAWRPQVAGRTVSYSITTQTGANGSISPNSPILTFGASQTFTIFPDSGFQITDVLIDGTSIGPVTTYTFSNIATNHTISVAFSAVTASESSENATSSIISETPETPAKSEIPEIPADWCYNFNKSLGWADSGTPEIIQLHTALQKEGILYAPDSENIYFEATAKAVIEFQTKYKIFPATGYTGVRTRAKLNQLYGCTPTTNQNIQNIPPATPQTPPPANLQPGQPPVIEQQASGTEEQTPPNFWNFWGNLFKGFGK